MTARYTDAERWAAYSLAVDIEHASAGVVPILRRLARRYARSARSSQSAVVIEAYRNVAAQSRLVARAIAREQRKAARS